MSVCVLGVCIIVFLFVCLSLCANGCGEDMNLCVYACATVSKCTESLL